MMLRTTYTHPVLGDLVMCVSDDRAPSFELGDHYDELCAPGVREPVAMIAEKVFDAVLGVADTANAVIESTRCANDFLTGLGYKVPGIEDVS